MRCEASAPGKVIIGGEHWVVHGGTAVAAAIGLRARAICEPVEGGMGVVIETMFGAARLEQDRVTGAREAAPLARAVQAVAEALGVQPVPARCRVESSIPPGAGLGSSAATAVAAAAAYAALLLGGERPPLDAVNSAAYEAEKITHGRPSGIDNTVSTFGGFLAYRRGEKPRLLSSKPADATLYIVDTGVPRSTRRAVETFTSNLSLLGSINNLSTLLINLAEETTRSMIQAIESGDVDRLGALMYLAHGLLNAMGVSHSRIEEAVHTARARGALGAKLTGAGMGGTVIVLCRGQTCGQVASALMEKGYNPIPAALGAEGVRITCTNGREPRQ